MTFNYNGKQYDLRFKSRYLPEGFKHVDTFDLMTMLSNRTATSVKRDLLKSYLPTAELA